MVVVVATECSVTVYDFFNRSVCKMLVVPKIGEFNAGFSQRRPEFISSIIYTEFLGDGLTLEQVCLQALQSPSTNHNPTVALHLSLIRG